ncbi:reticulon-like protein B21 isoform X2 [Oryza brachyantha]|uniref:Reticulon-like protein n=1 Tax=Oryza brachyantha TaxID=4533 RepID=J3MRT9_ORYBR|nr:reticulon-like protein B21 isoform X2 [Oryza brachyantha]
MQQQGGGAATRRRLSVPRSGGAGGAGTGASVWETRMKMDEVKGGVKVFSAGGEDADEEGLRVYRRLRHDQGGAGGTSAAAAKKRRNWKASEPVTAIGDLRKPRSDAAAVGVVTTAKRSVTRVTTPEKKVAAAAAAAAEVKEVVVVEVPETNNMEDEAEGDYDEELDEEEELEAEDDQEEEKEVLDQDHMAIDGDEAAKSTAPNQVDEEDLEPPTKRGIKIIQTSVEDERAANPEPVKPPQEKKIAATIDLRAMNPEPIVIPPVEKKAMPVIIHRMTNAEPAKPSPEKKASPLIGRRIPKQEPVTAPPVEEEYEEIQGRPSAPSRSNGRMQNIVDLVMWRDVSKSTLVFGLGTFLLISSSYAKDLNYNTITAASYLGLVYLGLRFLSKSILNRGESVDCDDAERSGERYLVGEEEAIWLLRLVLPYINEVLLNLRSLFSGEPATTMKLALLLFAMARCGNFVTLWTLAKLVFFGVFIIPKVCSSYSTQLARYGRFWLERLRDGWESCSHKKAVVAAVFTLVWNVSSTVARVWAVFMLVVAMKCYQQRMMEYGWSSTVEDAQEAGDDEPPQVETPARSSPAKAQDHEAQAFGAAAPRHRRTPVSGEFARERLRVRGGIQPR